MVDDLGTADREVHAQAQAVLRFWFDTVGPDRHFAKDDALDARIATEFGALHQAIVASDARRWRGAADTLLAAVIVIDQFSRNMFRGTARAFAADPLGLELALVGIARGDDRAMANDRRAFLYMPLMHAEDRGVARFSMACFEALGAANNLKFARDHAAVIDRFGRYPSRNVALGRQSTPAELDYLRTPGAGW